MSSPGDVFVLGAGTMGHGIAQVCATAGFGVYLADRTLDIARQALEKIHKNLEGAVERQKLTAEEARAVMGRIGATDSLDFAAHARLVIESVPEDKVLKRQMLEAAEARCKDATLLCSNTSSLSITELQAGLRVPSRVIGLHFFNPVPVMALVEIVRGELTSAESVERATEFVKMLDKQHIVVRDSPGFATSRLGIALGNEAMRMLEEGVAKASDIDRAMELGYRHPMGPLRLSDLVGLDVRLAITEHLYRELGTDTFRPPQILRRLVRAGKLGRKTREGFYTYDN